MWLGIATLYFTPLKSRQRRMGQRFVQVPFSVSVVVFQAHAIVSLERSENIILDTPAGAADVAENSVASVGERIRSVMHIHSCTAGGPSRVSR